jgi:GGDEF domain-containing protein
MISLKPYLLGESKRDVESSYQRIIDLILQAVSIHAVEGDRADYERFQADMGTFAARLTPKMSNSDRFVVVGEALRTFEEYNRHTTRFLRTQTVELQKMIAMLTQTVIAVGASSEASVTKLQEIEGSLNQALRVDDIRLLKTQLGECLLSVRGEALRQKAEGKIALESLQKELAQSQVGSSGASPVSLDPATGLPGKADAERELQQASLTGPCFLLLAVVDRLQAINARFGYAVGDKVLGLAAQHFRSSLPAEDKLYRWQGPALVAVLHRHSALDSVRSEVGRFAEKKLEEMFNISGRSILLPISASWTVFPLVPPLDVLFRKIEIFTAAHVPRDYV